MANKQAYFQGGGGVNEPTPGKKKYKSDPALVMQPRFKEPLYRNYDTYETPGEHTPGGGFYQNMDKYDSVKDFIDKKRKRMKDKYKSDDSWQLDNGKRTKENPNIKARAILLSRIIKSADHMMPPKEHGTSIYNWQNSPYQGIPKAPKRHDSNNIDFPADEYIDPNIVAPEPTDVDGGNPVGEGNQMGGYLDEYLPENDFEEKPPTVLDFGRDYDLESIEKLKKLTPEAAPHDLKSIEKLLNKYDGHGLYGLPDGVDMPQEDLTDPTDINPDYGTVGPETLMHEDKWNI